MTERRTMAVEGRKHEIVGIFTGDGKRYDEIRSANEPRRIGTLLLRPLGDDLLDRPEDLAIGNGPEDQENHLRDEIKRFADPTPIEEAAPSSCPPTPSPYFVS